MDNKSTTKRMIGAVVLVLIAALLLAWLLKGKNRSVQEQELIAQQTQTAEPILGFPGVNQDGQNVDGAAAQQLADTGQAAQQEPTAQEAPYTMGADSQQQAPDAGTATVAGGEGKAAAGTDEGSMVAGRTDESTGFQIRDSGSKTEQRVIVENGEIKAGTGSMGSGSEVVAADAGKTDGTGTVEQAVADDVAQAARTAEAAVVEEAAKA
ncbi:MAG TPA: hypothetical protein PLN94_03025, partial [Thiolinea sp.]|nr:hypothetical protein [Thiolinea sp.]